MKLLAISDLHVGYAANRGALAKTPSHLEDWLILAGDIGETADHLCETLDVLQPRFARVIWVPGNHDLWTRPAQTGLRGVQKYLQLIDICRSRGVVTPEDPYPLWPGEGGPHRIAPLFLLYDYSFAPAGVEARGAVEWAMQAGIVCTDEYVLHPDPYPSRAAWCEARCAATEGRLAQAIASDTHPLVLVNHFPLMRELVELPRVPRFAIWCGTERSRTWHIRFRASVVVYGHLHTRTTRRIDGVRFEEVSLGYPGQWHVLGSGLESYLRQILPSPEP